MKVFVAAPFTQLLQEGGGSVPVPYRAWLETLIQSLRDDGHDVVSAHEREAWGEAIEPASSALKADLESILDAEVLVADIGDPPSPGVQMELGIALVANKRIVVLAHSSYRLPYLVTGMESVGDAVVHHYEDPSEVHAVISGLVRGEPAVTSGGADNGASAADSKRKSRPRRRRVGRARR